MSIAAIVSDKRMEKWRQLKIWNVKKTWNIRERTLHSSSDSIPNELNTERELKLHCWYCCTLRMWLVKVSSATCTDCFANIHTKENLSGDYNKLFVTQHTQTWLWIGIIWMQQSQQNALTIQNVILHESKQKDVAKMYRYTKL